MPEAKRLIGQEMSLDEVMDEVRKDASFYRSSGGGVTLSGGEPLTQADFAEAVLGACRRMGIPTCLETCGYASFRDLARVCAQADVVYYDVKVIDEEAHRRLTGVSNRRVLDNMRRLGEARTSLVVRCPVVPGCNDDEEQVRSLARLCARLAHVTGLELLPYHHLGEHKYERLQRGYSLAGVPLMESDELDHLLSAAREEIALADRDLPCGVVAAFG